MDDLSFLWPSPEPVSLGPWSGTAVCFQLRDLARLQGIVRGLAGNPLLGHRVPLLAARMAAGEDYLAASPEGRAYAAALRTAILAAADWPPRLGSREADAHLATAAGQVLWLDTLLARTNPGFTAATAAGILASPEATAEQWLHLQAIAYADHPLDELDRLADPRPRRRGGAKWGEVVVEVAREIGYTFEEVGAMYLSQWLLLRCGGKYQPGETAGDRARARKVGERRRRLMRGEPGANGTG
jgi:hypothetical protein